MAEGIDEGAFDSSMDVSECSLTVTEMLASERLTSQGNEEDVIKESAKETAASEDEQMEDIARSASGSGMDTSESNSEKAVAATIEYNQTWATLNDVKVKKYQVDMAVENAYLCLLEASESDSVWNIISSSKSNTCYS